MICIRGAITVEFDEENHILERTIELMKEIEKSNSLDKDKVISMIFTATDDIKSVAPSKAARKLGYVNAGLLNFNEMYVEGYLPKCIRVMIFYDSDLKQSEANHVYLRDSRKLRPDLF